MSEALRESRKSALILLAFAVAGTALLAFTYSITRDNIAASEEAQKRALLEQVLAPGSFDNDLLEDVIELPPAELLGTAKPSQAYRARLGGKPAGVVLEAVAPDGYSGRIQLLVAIHESGKVSGVRVVSHKETPGLGDYIEIARSPWIKGFDGKVMGPSESAAWKVRKDGGSFDYVTGATITPRAVMKAVKRALEYFNQNRERLFAAPVETKP